MRYNHCGVIVRHTLRAPSGAPPGNKGQIPGKTFGKKKKCAHTRPRAGTASTTRLFALESVRVDVVGNISACHADARGSIPRRGDAKFFFLRRAWFLAPISGTCGGGSQAERHFVRVVKGLAC